VTRGVSEQEEEQEEKGKGKGEERGLPFTFLTGSITERNSSVPTVVEASKGVKRKWFRGATTMTS
jgi:hypothetical protein